MTENERKMLELVGATEEDTKPKDRFKEVSDNADRIEAQSLYTALMTDTLLESEVV